MSLKHLLPTFRNRYRFVLDNISEITKVTKSTKMLNLGTGEGEYDQSLAQYTEMLIACDINQGDIDLAKQINKLVPNLHYDVKNALETEYEFNSFDLIVCTEVIEHVGDPEKLILEMSRILKPGGKAVMTFPSQGFPFTYDPINYIAQKLDVKMPFISQGAYSFGHDYLINYSEFVHTAEKYGFQIQSKKPLGGYFIGLIEMYWTGLFQYFFKSNTTNLAESNKNVLTIRPKTNSIPKIVKLTDILLSIDRKLFTSKNESIGIGVVLVKR